MASTSSRSSARIRDKDKAVRGVGGGRDTAEGLTRPGRTTRRSNRLKPEPQPIIVNFNGDVQITKSTLFGRPPDELEQLRRSRPTLPATPHAYGKTAPRIQRPHHTIAVDDEEAEEESEEFESDRDSSCEDEPSDPPLASRVTSTSTQKVQTWRDSGYSGSTRGSKREKNEAYRASLSRRSSDGSLVEEGASHTKRKQRLPSVESNAEEDATSEDNETHLATQGDDGGDNDDGSDDDFERRQMKVATFDNNQVDVHVILDTGTKPDWISSRFLTEKLGLKYTRLSEEENKQEFSDFNGNKFNGIGKAELMVSSNDFNGFSCRKITFLVAKGGTFQILLGSRTIKKEKLLCKPLDAQMEGVFPAVQTDPKKAEQVIIVQNKEKQNREGAERDKIRDEMRRAKAKERKESKSSSSSAARLAQESKPQRRRERSASSSLSRSAEHPVNKCLKPSWKKTKAPLDERASDSSLSGGGAAIND